MNEINEINLIISQSIPTCPRIGEQAIKQTMGQVTRTTILNDPYNYDCPYTIVEFGETVVTASYIMKEYTRYHIVWDIDKATAKKIVSSLYDKYSNPILDTTCFFMAEAKEGVPTMYLNIHDIPIE